MHEATSVVAVEYFVSFLPLVYDTTSNVEFY
jgi:hypothetical protein